MNKNWMIAVCLFSAGLRAAESGTSFVNLNDPAKVQCLVNGILFSVIKGDICKSRHADQASLIVVGRNQQRQLQQPNFGDSSVVGTIGGAYGNAVYMLPDESTSKSDDDTYKPFGTEDTLLWQKAQKKQLPIDCCKVWTVIEPRIMYRELNWGEGKTFGYFPERQITEDQYRFVNLQFYGNDAIKEAGEDLLMCYKKIFEKALIHHTAIALDELSTPVGFPRDKAVPIILSAIVQSLMSIPTFFDKINRSVVLFTKKRSSFNQYKELVKKYIITD